MNIITGNKGFVGTNLTTFLQNKNKQIIGVTRSPNGQEIDYEALNVVFFNNTDSIIHLAGKAHDLKRTADEDEYFEVNTHLTISLFDVFLQSNCNVFIYMSSVKAAADNLDGILTENHIPNPVSAYGRSKLEAENYILSKEIPVGKRVYILRPCMIHGPGNKGNLNLLLKAVRFHIPWVFGSFENKRSYCSIDNLCFIIDRILSTPTMKSGIYHIADDESISTNKLIRIIAKTLGKRSIRINLPKPILLNIAKLGDKLKFPVNSQVLNKITGTYEVSNLKIKQELGIKKLPLSTEEGLRKTVQHYKHD